jgi:molybdopterin-guanine dinucleotide biosynthesis protein
MRIVSISGTNDSGKTTAIKDIITILGGEGKPMTMILSAVNKSRWNIYAGADLDVPLLPVW